MKFFINRYAVLMKMKDRAFVNFLEVEARKQDEDTIALVYSEFVIREELLDIYVRKYNIRAKVEKWLTERKRIKK